MNKHVELNYKDLHSIELDKLSKLTMTYSEKGFTELLQDIKDKGQLVPVTLRDGKILDGRHRHKACVELGVDMKAVEVGSISEEEALNIVITNTISKSATSDAAKIEAYLICRAKDVTKVDMPKVFARLNKNYVDKISYIEKENPKYLQALLEHKQVRLHNIEYDKIENYGTINSIWKTLKNNKRFDGEIVVVEKDTDEAVTHPVDIRAVFNNTVAEKEYWELYHIGKEEGVNLHPSSVLGKKLVGLVKHKYGSSKVS